MDADHDLTRPARASRLNVVLMIVLMAVLAVVSAGAAGYRLFTVQTGSMRPALPPGAIIVSRYVPATSLRPGDVATFVEPGGASVTHRVVSVRGAGSALLVTTKGDANAVGETWRVPRSKRVARELFRVPSLSGWVVWAIEAVVIALAVGFFLRRRRRRVY